MYSMPHRSVLCEHLQFFPFTDNRKAAGPFIWVTQLKLRFAPAETAVKAAAPQGTVHDRSLDGAWGQVGVTAACIKYRWIIGS